MNKEVFKNLKAALKEFRPRPKLASTKPKVPCRKKPLKKAPLEGSRNSDVKPAEDKYIASFEPSNFFYARDSMRLRHLEAWFKEQSSYEDSRYIECYPVEI